jgi:hypothetical protein
MRWTKQGSSSPMSKEGELEALRNLKRPANGEGTSAYAGW